MSLGDFGEHMPCPLSLNGVFFSYFESSPQKGGVWLIFINSLLVLLIFSVLPSCRWKYKEVKYGIWAFLRIEKDPADDFQLVHEFLFFCEYSFWRINTLSRKKDDDYGALSPCRFPCCVLSYFSLVFDLEQCQLTTPSHKSQLSRAIN